MSTSVYSIECTICPEQVVLAVEDGHESIEALSIPDGWTFNSEDGWRCPGCASAGDKAETE